MQNVYYIVKIRDEYIEKLNLTTISNIFCGKYLKAEYDNVYFSLNGSGANVIVPEKYIEFCAPSKKLWERQQEEE